MGLYSKYLVYCVVFYVLIVILVLSASALIMKNALYEVNKVKVIDLKEKIWLPNENILWLSLNA